MSLQWIPQWEEVEVSKYGVRLKVLRDRTTGLYACPVCGLGKNATYFFSVHDLLVHIVAHARQEVRVEKVPMPLRPSVPEEAEGEAEEEAVHEEYE